MEETVKELIAQLGAKQYKKGKEFKGYEVYVPVYAKMAYIGLPLVVLVKGNEARISTGDEALDYLDVDDEPSIMQGKGEEE